MTRDGTELVLLLEGPEETIKKKRKQSVIESTANNNQTNNKDSKSNQPIHTNKVFIFVTLMISTFQFYKPYIKIKLNNSNNH